MSLAQLTTFLRWRTIAAAITVLLCPVVSHAQSVVPDPTWGNESTTMTQTGVEIKIEGGATRGDNLFHSFLEFNVPLGSSAHFMPSSTVSNIFGRVIDGSPSAVQGVLGVVGDANLFLMNPSGIVFGPESRLDVQGSFVATTATGIQFGTQGQFEAVSSQPPDILTINPSTFLFSQATPASITNQSIASNLQNSTFTDGLRVADGHSLLLVGGDILLPQGQLRAPGGVVELAGLSEPGNVEVNKEGDLWTLNIPSELVRADVLMTESAVIDVSANSGGSATIHANNISILGGSQVCTGVGTNGTCGGIESIYETPANMTGDIVLNATNSVVLSDKGTTISNDNALEVESDQEIGNIVISANEAFFGNESQINSRRGTPLEIDTGDILVNANSIFIENGSDLENVIDPNSFRSNSLQGGDTELVATDFILVSDASVANTVVGKSQGGDILFQADNILFEDTEISTSTSFGAGTSGDVHLIADESIILTRSEVDVANAFGSAGVAGDIVVRAPELSLFESSLNAEIDTGGIAGDIEVQIDGMVFLFDSEITSTNGNGQITGGVAGDVFLRAGSLVLTEDSLISASTVGKEDDTEGLAGEIRLIVDDTISLSNSEILSQSRDSDELGRDRGGQIILDAAALILTEASEISVSTESAARAGDITIRTEDFILLEEGSVISNVVAPEATGSGGNITIQTQRLGLTSGGQVNASVIAEINRQSGGEGAGGNIFITADEFLTIAGSSPDGLVDRFDRPLNPLSAPGTSSGLYSNSGRGALGPGGEIIVNAGVLSVAEGGVISTQTFNSTDGGSIIVNAQDLELISGGQVLTGTSGEGAAGSVALLVQDQVTLSGQDAQLAERLERYGETVVVNASPAAGVFANTSETSSGPGGEIRLQANSADILTGAAISAQSSGLGSAGNIFIALRENLQLQDADITTAAQQSTGGSIMVKAQQATFRGDSDIRTNVARGSGGGGNIVISANLILSFDDSDILAFAQAGEGGNITLNTPGFFGQNFRPASEGISLDSLDGNGRVDVNATGQIASGSVSIPDVSFVEDSLTALEETVVDTDALTAGSCITRSENTEGSFAITGSEGIAQQPGSDMISTYSTGTVQVPSGTTMQTFQEPQGIYQLDDGRLILIRKC